ncbi:MAG TPA: ATP-binding protein [Patescibacteria group bacterium]|jgi:signal transduction histidine kinase|nr:ATP-binding protein [Patescibacteria group bacterium]
MTAVFLQTTIFYLALLSNLILAFIVFRYAPRNTARYTFVAFVLAQVFWIASNQLAFNNGDKQFLLLARLTMFAATFHIFLFFLFIYSFLETRDIFRHSRLLFLLLAFFLLTAAFTLGPFVFINLGLNEQGELAPVPGPGMPVFGAFVATCVILALYSFIKKYRRAKGMERLQLQYVGFGFSLTLVFVIAFSFVTFLILKALDTVKFGHLYTLPFVILSAIAMVKYQLLDIRPLIARALSYILGTVMAAGIFASILVFIARTAFHVSLDLRITALVIALTTIAGLTFERLRKRVAILTDRIFFRGQYDSEKLLSALTKIMAETIDLPVLTQKLIRTLIDEMRLTKAAFLLMNNHEIIDVQGIGYPARGFKNPKLEELIHGLPQDKNQALVFEYLDNENIRALFRVYDLVVLIPIRVEKQEVAAMILGPKASGEIYTEQDIEVLGIFAAEAGIAIQNAKAYTEIKKFSQVLEKRVEERTKQLQDAQERELAKAKDIAKLKDEFVFIAAHELRTPVTAIKGFLELVSEATDKFPKDVREHLQAISLASNHLGQLINDLLSVSRSDVGKLTIKAAEVDFNPLLEGIMEELTSLIQEKNIRVVKNIRLTKLINDKDKLKEVLVNLISNAVKYNKQGGLIEISALEYPSEGLDIIEVHDSGYGIPKDQQDKVFGKFFRASGKSTENVLGTGLGLFITRMLVEKMGGTITFSSIEGQGSTFAFSLPILKPENQTKK